VTSGPGLHADERVLGGRYRLLSRIADGGMATVYLAIDERLGRRVAVKVLRPDLARDDEFVGRFHREARLAAGLSHPNIVAVHDFHESSGQPGEDLYLVMEYVDGQTLRQKLLDDGAMSVRQATHIMTALLSALDEAHRADLVHRDVKPENVLVRDDGSIKVTDFGLARAVTSSTRTSTTGILMGTVSYLAPEQVDGDRADARSDVYAAGLMLYELLTGQRAFQGDNPAHVMYQHVHGEVPLASDRVSTVPLELDQVIARATARDPNDRPETAGAFIEVLRDAIRQLSDEEFDAAPVFLAGMAPGTQPVAHAPDPTQSLPADPPLAAAGTDGTGGTDGGDIAGGGQVSPTQRLGAIDVDATQRLTALDPDPSGQDLSDTTATTATTATGTTGPGGDSADAAAGPVAPRRRRKIWPWLVALVLLSGAAGTWWWYDTTGPGSLRIVPTLVHLSLADAEKALSVVDLRAATTEAFSETEPAGQVISAEPQPGTEVTKRSTVALVISKGQERYAVPAVTGAARGDVERLLKERTLALGKVTEDFSETVAKDLVISQDPPPDTSVKRDTPVNVVISKGRAPIPVPSVIDKPADEAQKALEALGLKVVRGEPVNSETVPSGAVVSQTPATGTLFKGDTVTIVPSKGPVLVKVPDVTLKKVNDATKILKDLGLQVKVSQVFGGVLKTVRFQDPAAGTMVRRGTVVTLTVI
jgi:serine/threonine-protein kinase